MNNILNILREFSEKEIKDLVQFLKSPYHNKSNRQKVLLREIVKFYPNFINEKLNKIYLHNKVSPKRPFNDSTFRNLISDLQILIERFLVIKEVFKSGYEKNILLLQALMKKKQDGLFRINIDKTNSQLEKDGIDSSYYTTKSLLELATFNYFVISTREKTAKDIKQSMDNMNRYTACSISCFISELINVHLKFLVNDSKFHLGDMKSFSLSIIESLDIPKISSLVKKVDKDNFILEVYWQLLLTFQHMETRQNYLNYKLIVGKYFKQFSIDELSYHYTMLMTYCVIKNLCSTNKAVYDIELFKIYNTFLEEKLFINSKSNFIDEELFRNILVLALRIRKFDWALNFIDRYQRFLSPRKSKNMTNLCYAEYYYHVSSAKHSVTDLNTAFTYMAKIKEESFVNKYDIKILTLMMFYDLGYNDNLHCHIKNYRQFLWRNSLVPLERKKKLNRFLNILERLIFLNERDPNIDIENLNSEIDNFKNFNYQRWLLDKVQAFDKNTKTPKLKQV